MLRRDAISAGLVTLLTGRSSRAASPDASSALTVQMMYGWPEIWPQFIDQGQRIFYSEVFREQYPGKVSNLTWPTGATGQETETSKAQAVILGHLNPNAHHVAFQSILEVGTQYKVFLSRGSIKASINADSLTPLAFFSQMSLLLLVDRSLSIDSVQDLLGAMRSSALAGRPLSVNVTSARHSRLLIASAGKLMSLIAQRAGASIVFTHGDAQITVANGLDTREVQLRRQKAIASFDFNNLRSLDGEQALPTVSSTPLLSDVAISDCEVFLISARTPTEQLEQLRRAFARSQERIHQLWKNEKGLQQAHSAVFPSMPADYMVELYKQQFRTYDALL